MQPLRFIVQCGFLGFMIWLGYRFYQFTEVAGSAASATIIQRPNGIEAVLPISGLLGTAYWAKGGGINDIHPAAVVIFVTVIFVSFLLRRSFCSWICPVATISEYAWKGGFKLFSRNWHLPKWFREGSTLR